MRLLARYLCFALAALFAVTLFVSEPASAQGVGDPRFTFSGHPPPAGGEAADGVGNVWQCWSCTFVGRFIQTVDFFARVIYATFAPDASALLTYVFAIWIMLRASLLFLPGFAGGGGGMQALGQFAWKSAIFFLAIWLLTPTGSRTWWDAVYEVSIVTAAEVGTVVLDSAAQASGAFDSGMPYSRSQTVQVDNNCGGFAAFGSPITEINEFSTEVIAPAKVASVTCIVAKVQYVAEVGLNIGFDFILGGSSASYIQAGSGLLTGVVTGIADIIFGVIGGLFLIVLYGTMLLSTPFAFIDIFFRVALVASIMPLLLLCLLVKPLQDALKTGLLMVLGALAGIVGISLVYAIGIVMLAFTPQMLPVAYFGHEGSEGFRTFTDLYRAIDGEGFNLSPLDMAYWWIAMGALVILLLMTRSMQLIASLFGAQGADNSIVGKAQGISALGIKAVGTAATLSVVAAGGVGAAGLGSAGLAAAKGGGGREAMAAGVSTIKNLVTFGRSGGGGGAG